MAPEADVVVVGGGIGGLTAALHLQRAGARYALLEGSDRLGGVIRTESQEGFLMEAGPDSLLTQKPQGMALCRELGLADRIVPANVRQGGVSVLIAGRLRTMPEGLMLGVPTRVWPMVTTSLFSWPAKLRMAADIAMRPRQAADDESIAAFFGRHFGRQVVERVGEPLLAGIHAGDPERLSMSSNFPRFVEMERRQGSLIRALARVRPASGSGPAFVSLKQGLQELVDAAVARLAPVAIRTGWSVDAVRRRGDGWVVEGGGGEIEAARVIVALPPSRAARVLASVDAELAALIDGIRSVSTAVVYLGYRRDDVAHPLDGHGLVVPRTEGLRMSAVSFVSTKFPGRAPEGHVLLRAFLGGARDPAVLEQDDAALLTLVQSELAGLLGVRGTPVLTRVFRWPQGTPQLEVGHAARLVSIEERMGRLPGLALTGAGLRGTGIPDTVGDAIQQVTRLLGESRPSA